jgi:hypothetical protein
MAEWSPGAQRALLGWLASMIAQESHPSREVELWWVRKAERELRSVAVYLATGIDVRLLEATDFRRTQLVKDAPAVEELAGKWQRALIERGWAVRGEGGGQSV